MMKPCAVCGYCTPSNAKVALLVDGRYLLERVLCPEHRVVVEDALQGTEPGLPFTSSRPGLRV
jgi:hypothetical protein